MGQTDLANLKKGVKSAEHAYTGPYREYPWPAKPPQNRNIDSVIQVLYFLGFLYQLLEMFTSGHYTVIFQNFNRGHITH